MSSPDDLTSDLGFGATVRQFAANQRLFDRYALKEILGRGGMGIVWRAFDEQLERDVALKFLPEMLAFDEQAIVDLKRETKKSQELRHHHIVQVYDFVTDKQNACISMEYVDGSTLSAIKAHKPQRCFAVDEVRDWVEQLCEALAYAHDRARVVHRDLKPANLMVDSKGDLKVTDFGIARSLTDSATMMTRTQRTSGTLVYMSPQQLDGEKASHLDDIYSAGATLYELLTSKPPFHTGQIDRQIHEKAPLAIEERRVELDIGGGAPVPRQWQEAIAACLAKDPAKRPQSAIELSQRLGIAEVLGSERRSTATTPPLHMQGDAVNGYQTHSVRKRRERLLLRNAAVLLVFASVIAGAVYFGAKAGREPNRPVSIRTERERQTLSTAAGEVSSAAAPATSTSLPLAPPTRPIAKSPPSIAIQDDAAIVSRMQPKPPMISTPPPAPLVSNTPPATVQSIPRSFVTSDNFSMAGELCPETRMRALIWEEVLSWNDARLRYAINEMYARGGYDFVKPEVKSVFLNLPWYRQRVVRGRTQDEAARQLSALEYRNLELLQKARDRKH